MRLTAGACALGLALTAAAVFPSCATEAARPDAMLGGSPLRRVADDTRASALDLERARRERLAWPDDRARFAEAARVAWAFMARRTQPGTGFIVGSYPFATIWDVGSMIAGIHSAHGLGLIDDAAYRSRVHAILRTLQQASLYDGYSFNKAYDGRTGKPTAPWGVSTTDLGRLLVWLRIVSAADPLLAQDAAAIVRRTDFNRLVQAGYLWGETERRSGERERYQEGTVGYEQYAAHGFALWGHRAELALDLSRNGLPIEVMGQPLLADYRRYDRLTPEPFLLWGLEIGLDGRAEALLARLLAAQEARYRKTGQLTVVSEDAIDQPPHWFYYYCVYANGRDFAVDTQDRSASVDAPRWISAKGAFAFHALMPTAYTRTALDAVAASARSVSGAWASGVLEGTSTSTRTDSLNTAAVILTAALYDREGAPILPPSQP